MKKKKHQKHVCYMFLTCSFFIFFFIFSSKSFFIYLFNEMDFYKEDEFDQFDDSKEKRVSNFQNYEITKKILGDSISEEEFVNFDYMRNALLNNEDPSVIKQICNDMLKIIDDNKNIANLLNSSEICNFLLSFSIAMKDDPIILASTLTLISNIFMYNPQDQIMEYFTNIDFVDVLFFVCSECLDHVYLLIPAYECLSMMIQADSSLIIPFLQKNGLEMMLNNLIHSNSLENKIEVEESIGIIAYQFFIAIDEGIKEENGDIIQKLELSDYHMDCIRDIFCFLLGDQLLNPVFGIMHHIITYHDEIFNQLLGEGICSDIFNLSFPLQSFLQKVIDYHINKVEENDLISQEPLDISRKKKTILNALRVFDEMTQKITDLSQLSEDFPLIHLIEMFLKCSEYSSLTNFDSICQEILKCLSSFIEKSPEFTLSLFRTNFKTKIFQKWELLNFAIKKSFINLLLKLFSLLPQNLIMQEFNDDDWEFIMDFIDSDNQDLLILLATAIKHLVDCGYSVLHFAPFVEKFQDIELDIDPNDYQTQDSNQQEKTEHSLDDNEKEQNEEEEEETHESPYENSQYFFDILVSMIDDALNEEEDT